MFDIGFGEMVLLAAIALIALGPKQLPEVARSVGRFLNQLKRTTGDFQRTLAEAAESTTHEIQETRKKIESEVITPLNELMHNQHVPPDAPIIVAPAAAPAAAEVAVDEKNQLSFDIEKKEP